MVKLPGWAGWRRVVAAVAVGGGWRVVGVVAPEYLRGKRDLVLDQDSDADPGLNGPVEEAVELSEDVNQDQGKRSGLVIHRIASTKQCHHQHSIGEAINM